MKKLYEKPEFDFIRVSFIEDILDSSKPEQIVTETGVIVTPTGDDF